VVVTNRDILSAARIFGFNEKGNDEENGAECTVCLTEPKDTVLLPCRHLCVCKTCFSHIDKCPVCRSLFDTHVRFDASDERGAAHPPSMQPTVEEIESDESEVDSDDENVRNPLHTVS
jgi:hypothetical protein